MTRAVASALAFSTLLLVRPAAAQDDGAPASEGPEEGPEEASETPEGTHDDVIVSQPDPPPSPPPAPGTRYEGPMHPPGGVPLVGQPVQPQPQQAQPAPGPPPRPEPPPIPPPLYSVELQVRSAFPEESSFDRAMDAFGYDGVRIEMVGYFGIQVPLVEWLWLGGRFGMRGRHWTHLERDSAVVSAGDLLLTAQVRFSLGRVVELGVLAGGGAGLVVLEVNGVASDQVVGRFQIEAVAAFKIGRHFALGPRLGWGYFQWEGLNRYGHGVDIGGPYIGLSLEARE